jgi:hypothetical protein
MNATVFDKFLPHIVATIYWIKRDIWQLALSNVAPEQRTMCGGESSEYTWWAMAYPKNL